jgi:hypothetical protein
VVASERTAGERATSGTTGAALAALAGRRLIGGGAGRYDRSRPVPCCGATSKFAREPAGPAPDRPADHRLLGTRVGKLGTEPREFAGEAALRPAAADAVLARETAVADDASPDGVRVSSRPAAVAATWAGDAGDVVIDEGVMGWAGVNPDARERRSSGPTDSRPAGKNSGMDIALIRCAADSGALSRRSSAEWSSRRPTSVGELR